MISVVTHRFVPVKFTVVEPVYFVVAFQSLLLEYKVTNAVLGWIAIGVLLVSCIVFVRRGMILWAGLAFVVTAIAIVPPLVSRQVTEMIAWEVLALSTFPLVARLGGVGFEPVTYLGVASLGLIIAAELDAFTAVEMTPSVAVGFVVIVTMAVAGGWAIARYVSDIYLATTLLSDQTSLMWDLIIATGTGIGAGIVFEFYFRRISPGHVHRRTALEGQ